jgi:hypothetical protein
MLEAEVLKGFKVKRSLTLINGSLKDKIMSAIADKISLHLYDMMIKTDRAVPSPFLAKQAVLTAISRVCTADLNVRVLVAKSFVPDILWSRQEF